MSDLYGDSGKESANATEIPPLNPAQISMPSLLKSTLSDLLSRTVGTAILKPLAIKTKTMESKLISQ